MCRPGGDRSGLGSTGLDTRQTYYHLASTEQHLPGDSYNIYYKSFANLHI